MKPTRTIARKARGTAVGFLRSAATFALLLLVSTASARACPLCRDGATTDAAAATTTPDAAGLDFSTSIYAMLGMVTCVAGVVGRAMVKAVRA